MTAAIDARCPIRMWARIIRRRNQIMVEVRCRHCRRLLAEQLDGGIVSADHRFALDGELVETRLARRDGTERVLATWRLTDLIAEAHREQATGRREQS